MCVRLAARWALPLVLAVLIPGCSQKNSQQADAGPSSPKPAEHVPGSQVGRQEPSDGTQSTGDRQVAPPPIGKGFDTSSEVEIAADAIEGYRLKKAWPGPGFQRYDWTSDKGVRGCVYIAAFCSGNEAENAFRERLKTWMKFDASEIKAGSSAKYGEFEYDAESTIVVVRKNIVLDVQAHEGGQNREVHAASARELMAGLLRVLEGRKGGKRGGND